MQFSVGFDDCSPRIRRLPCHESSAALLRINSFGTLKPSLVQIGFGKIFSRMPSLAIDYSRVIRDKHTSSTLASILLGFDPPEEREEQRDNGKFPVETHSEALRPLQLETV